MSPRRRHVDLDDVIVQHRAMGYSKQDTARRLMAPLDLIEGVWARMDLLAQLPDVEDTRTYRKKPTR